MNYELSGMCQSDIKVLPLQRFWQKRQLGKVFAWEIDITNKKEKKI
ncbi:MAG: hypothetical protein K2P55_16190 [Bacteroides acidifaciens]|jgi:hypothetical protein|nr:hypothetical protein [Bacteroides acidifaciens]